MTLPTITIRKKQYPKPSIDKLKRKDVKVVTPMLNQLQGGSLDVLWDLLSVLIPTLSEETLDDLDLGECKSILEKAGLANFDVEPEETADVSMGESSASTDS